MDVTPLESPPPELAPTTNQAGATSSSDAAQPKAARPEVQSEAVGSEPALDFNHPSMDYGEPILLLDGKEDWPVFGAPQALASGSSQSVDMPKGMLQGQLCFIPKGTRSLDAAESCHPVGTLYTRSLYVPRRDFLKGFPGISARYEWFAIDYRGTFTVRTPGTVIPPGGSERVWTAEL